MYKRFIQFLTVAFLVGVLALQPAGVFAHTNPAHSSDDAPSTNPQARKLQDEAHEKLEAKLKSVNDKVEQKRSEAKDQMRIKRCEAKEKWAKERFAKIQTVSHNALDRIDDSLARVKAFVNKKQLTVPNSDALLVDIEAKMAAAKIAGQAIKDSAEGFSCQNDDAKQQAELIKAKVAEFKTAAAAYRNSVQAYFKAVRGAAQAQVPTSILSPTPNPSESAL